MTCLKAWDRAGSSARTWDRRTKARGVGIRKGFLLSIPPPEKAELHLPWIQIQLVEVLPFQGDAQGFRHRRTLLQTDPGLLPGFSP